jgi:putative salt-induced outer membrane protein YdiY
VTLAVSNPPEQTVQLPSTNVVTIGTTAEKFWNRFNGDINFGMSYSKGNQSTQYNVNAMVEYPRERWSARATFSSNLSSSSGAERTTRNQFNFRADRLLRWNNYFYTGGFGFLQSSEQGINRQTTVSGGVGHYFRNTSRLSFSVIGAFGWQRTNYAVDGTNRSAQNVAAAIVSTDLKYRRFKKTTLNIEATLLPSISDPGRFYFKINQSYYVKLFSDLSWNTSFYGNWDTRPPLGLSGSDFGVSSGIGWTFGNK